MMNTFGEWERESDRLHVELIWIWQIDGKGYLHLEVDRLHNVNYPQMTIVIWNLVVGFHSGMLIMFVHRNRHNKIPPTRSQPLQDT